MITTGNSKWRNAGFTLIEVMVVVVILGILAAIVVPKLMSRPDQARIVKAQRDIRALEAALNLYRLDRFSYPSTDEGLGALVNPPVDDKQPTLWKSDGYLDRLPMDPWKTPYQYLNPGVHGSIDLYSLGKDGQPSDDDITNWNLQ
ncbi:MAG: type II secretion system major pseudopilin GspG [Gammaproteobacteria bacterium]